MRIIWFSKKKVHSEELIIDPHPEEGECPILLESFSRISQADIPHEYIVSGKPVLKVTLKTCGHSFHPVALAKHWLLHSMRCPICKQGSDFPLSFKSLPNDLRERLIPEVDLIKREMRQDIIDVDWNLIHNLEEWHTQFMHGIRADLVHLRVPVQFVMELVSYRSWDNVRVNLQLHIMLFLERITSHQHSTLQQMVQTMPTFSQWGMRQDDSGSTVIEFYSLLVDEPEGMSMQRSQCRNLGRVLGMLGHMFPENLSDIAFSLIHLGEPEVMICETSRQRLSSHDMPPMFLRFEDSEREVGVIHLHQLPDSVEHGLSHVTLDLHKDDICDRLVNGYAYIYHSQNGLTLQDTV